VKIENILQATIIKKPWEHAVIDNLVDPLLLWEELPNWLNVLSENKNKILEKYGRYRNKKDKTWITWGIPIQSPGDEYPVHDDHYTKLWSLTIYLFPKSSSGTLLFDEDRKFTKEVKWKQGRALAFSCDPKGKKSWHRYHNNTNQFRTTMVVNIRTQPQNEWGIETVKDSYLHIIKE